jgi:hypothetical protein
MVLYDMARHKNVLCKYTFEMNVIVIEMSWRAFVYLHVL